MNIHMQKMLAMKENEDYIPMPKVGIFWYDVNRKELFGVQAVEVEPNGLIRITEDEKLDFEKDFSKFKQKYTEIVNFCKVFFRKLKESNYPKNGLIGDSFSKKIDRQIEDTIEFYNDIMANTINIPKKELLDLQKSYFAYITISRCLNSFIKIYNTNKLNYKIPELKNIPEPKYFDNIFNLNEFIQKYDTFEKLIILRVLND